MPSKVVRDYLKRITPLRRGIRALKSLVSRNREDFWIIEGQEQTSQQPFRLFFSGQLENRNYIAHLIMGDSWTETVSSRTWKKSLLKRARAENAGNDLVVIQTDKIPSAAALGPNGFVVPCWVGGEKNLHEATELARHSDHIKSDVRRIRKNRLGYRVTRDPAEFSSFYYTMYLPYIKQVYGDHALLMSYEEMQAAIDQCELFLITQDDQDIAGGILVYNESDLVRGWSLGVKDGDFRWVKAGALAAFEYLQTGYLLDKGYKRLHRGGSRPFLNDGALSFKKNRGMTITGRKSSWFTIIPVRDNAGVRGFLTHNPFIYEKEGTLKGAIFMTGEVISKDSISRLFRNSYIAGLDGLTLFCLSPGQDHGLSIQACGNIDKSGTLQPSLSGTN